MQGLSRFISSIFNNLASYQLLGLVNHAQSVEIVARYHAQIKVVAAFSLQLVNHLGVSREMLRAPIAGDWESYNTWDNQGELIRSAL